MYQAAAVADQPGRLVVKAGGAISLADQKLQVDGEENVGFAIDDPNVDAAGQKMPAVVAVAVEKFEPCCVDHSVTGLQRTDQEQ